MARVDRIKEEIGWLKVPFGLLAVIDASVLGWLARSYTKANPALVAAATIALIVLSRSIFQINRIAYRRFDDLQSDWEADVLPVDLPRLLGSRLRSAQADGLCVDTDPQDRGCTLFQTPIERHPQIRELRLTQVWLSLKVSAIALQAILWPGEKMRTSRCPASCDLHAENLSQTPTTRLLLSDVDSLL
jgi:hypothetical protein